MAKKPIKEMVQSLLTEFLKTEGYELYNLEFVKESKDWFLRVYIDRLDQSLGGIDMDDCEKVSRFLSEQLDQLDPIEQNYYLEVSSPGIDRELVKPEHFSRYEGEQVELKLYKAFDGEKIIKGQLLGLRGENILIGKEDQKIVELPKELVSKTKLAVVI